MFKNVDSSILHDSPKFLATQMSIKIKMDK